MPEELDQETLDALHQIFNMARNGNTEGLADAIDHGLTPNLTNDKGDTLLILSAYNTQPEIVDLLIARGAEIDRVNDRGQTALGSAVFRKSAKITRALIAAGADPDAGGQSARSIAQFFDLPEMMSLLS